jgi:hypothetical protein
LTDEVAPFGNPVGFREKACASLASTAGMFLVPCAYLALETYGPSSRVVFYDYLPFQGVFNFVLAATLGAWLGARCFRLVQSGRHYSIIRLMVGCLLGGALGLILASPLVLGAPDGTGIISIVLLVSAAIIPSLGAWWCGMLMFRSTQPTKRDWLGWFPLGAAAAITLWLVHPQFSAFPEHGTVAERETWARLNVRQYMSLTRTIAKIPQIQESVGRVTSIAPASHEQQVTGPTMDGMEFNMVLDVVGDRGVGVLHVRCTIDGDLVFDWQSGTWTTNGWTIEISTVPNLFHR